jgi:hypothetical protein
VEEYLVLEGGLAKLITVLLDEHPLGWPSLPQGLLHVKNQILAYQAWQTFSSMLKMVLSSLFRLTCRAIFQQTTMICYVLVFPRFLQPSVSDLVSMEVAKILSLLRVMLLNPLRHLYNLVALQY